MYQNKYFVLIGQFCSTNTKNSLDCFVTVSPGFPFIDFEN